MRRMKVSVEDIFKFTVPALPGTRAHEYISGKRGIQQVNGDPEVLMIVPYLPDGNPNPLIIFKDRSSLTAECQPS